MIYHNRIAHVLRLGVGVLAGLAALAGPAQIRTLDTFNSSQLARDDDGSTGLVNIGFTVNFFGTDYNQLYVNNNGNVTFASPLSTYTPFDLVASTNNPIIAPFFGDVDTRAPDSGITTYGTGTLEGKSVFAVDWIGVGVFSELPIYNSFQLLLISLGGGDFDFEFNYSMINWETGQASGGNSLGLGGDSAHVGYNNGAAMPTSFELVGSGVNGAFLNTNTTTGLIYNSLGTPFDGATTAGRYDFAAINGTVITAPPSPTPVLTAVPEPSTYGIIGSIALAGMAGWRRRRFARV